MSDNNLKTNTSGGLAETSSDKLLRPSGRAMNLNGIYLGVTKDTVDYQRMGRIRVYIPILGGNPHDEESWFVCSYASPFAGSTNVGDSDENSKEYRTTQSSYGFWMVPPDENNEVLVCFLNGDPAKGVWFGCLYQQYMNHSVPANASNKSHQEGHQGILPPVSEYNRLDSSFKGEPDPLRPRFDPLHYALIEQGIYNDPERGPTDASARRESPARVFGFKSPRGHHIYIDDGKVEESTDAPIDKNKRTVPGSGEPKGPEYIRMRTRNGVQILINDTAGYIFMVSKKGKSWLEISDDGIHSYTNGKTATRSQGNTGNKIDGDHLVEITGNLKYKVGGSVTFDAGGGVDVGGKTGVKITSSSGSVETKAKSDVVSNSGGSNQQGGSGGSTTSSGGSRMQQNTQPAKKANSSENIKQGSVLDVYPTKPGDINGYRGKTGSSGDIGIEELSGEKVQGKTSLPSSLFVTHQPWAGKSRATSGQNNTGGDTCHPTPFKNQDLGHGRKDGRAGGHSRPFQIGKPVDDVGGGNSKSRNGKRIVNNEHKTKAIEYWKSKGYSDNAIAAMLGHAQAESGINPGQSQINGPAYGFFQWDDRKQKLFNYLDNNGYSRDSLEGQLNFAEHEFNTTERGPGKILRDPNVSLEDANRAMVNFERYKGSNKPGDQKAIDRLETSRGHLDQLQGRTPTPPTKSDPPQKTSGADGEATADKGTSPIPKGKYRVSGAYLDLRNNGSGGKRAHQGLDMAAPTGTPIKAWKDGTVVVSKNSGGYGKYIIVKHGTKYHTLYAHCSVLDVSEGQTVKEGQVIAKVGSTGTRSTGPHLHFEVRGVGRPHQGASTPNSLGLAAQWGGTYHPLQMLHDTDTKQTPGTRDARNEGL